MDDYVLSADVWGIKAKDYRKAALVAKALFNGVPLDEVDEDPYWTFAFLHAFNGDTRALKVHESMADAATCCKSPIEQVLLCALYSLPGQHGLGLCVVGKAAVGGDTAFWLVSGDTATIHIQYPVGKYTADFALIVEGLPTIIIECDGHDHHERTKKQAAHDKKRDRYMTTKGYRVMRFTGSQIYKDPFACVEEVSGLLGALYCERREQVRASRKVAANG